MSSFGLLETGFVAKSQDEIEESIRQGLRDRVSPVLNLSEEKILAQFAGIISQEIADVWDAAQNVNSGFSPESATGERLDQLAALINLQRLAASPSTVDLVLNLDNGTTVPIGSQVSHAQTGEVFETTEAVTNSSGITDDFDAQAQSLNTGKIRAASGTLTVIDTPVAGWNSTTNPLDAVLGRDNESNAQLRARRLNSLASGSTTLAAILARVLNVDGVADAFILENASSDNPSAQGLPAHSFESVIDGGEDTEIAAAIFQTKPLGIQAFGSTTVGVTDSQGFSHTIGFSRPDEVDYFVEIDITIDPLVYGDGVTAVGSQAIADSIVDYGSLLGIGGNILMTLIECGALVVPGVLNITGLRVDTFAPPVNTADIVTPFRQLSLFDSSRITVNIAP